METHHLGHEHSSIDAWFVPSSVPWVLGRRHHEHALAGIDGSTLTAAAAAGVGLSAKSSAVIRTVAVGVSASGTVAVQVTAMGNVIANDVTAVISDSTVTAGKDVTVKAEDVPPSLIPSWIVPADRADELNDNLAGSPVDLDGNILAIMVSVAASGTVAVNASFMGNVITNDVQAIIDHSTVATTNGGKIDLDADSGAGIIALTVGVAGSGVVAVNATGYGNWIQNTVDASIRNGSNVHSAGLMELTADDDSSVRSLAVSVAGTGAVAVGALIGVNVITNTVTAEISGSTAASDSTLNLAAGSTSGIMALTAGVAASGAVSVLVSFSGNVITNTTRAAVTSGSNVDAAGAVSISAEDTSVVDALSFGVSGTGGVAVGVAISTNVIANTIETAVSGSTLDATAGGIDLTSESSAVIRALAIGVSDPAGWPSR